MILKPSDLYLRVSLRLKYGVGCSWHLANLAVHPITYSSRVKVEQASNKLNMKSLGENATSLVAVNALL